ncbi:hypothetical protein HDV03_000521 [Kappamyces sp. JEL0829]|nr:hypothetical protein HDV03_000521 [Kappamyces sp. JEL0829]
MYLIGELSSALVPFRNTTDYVANIIHVLAGLVGCSLGSIVLAAFVFHRHQAVPRTMFICSLVVSDVIFCGTMVIFGVTDLIHVLTVLVLAFTGISMQSLVFITLERYFAVVWQTPTTTALAKMIIGSVYWGGISLPFLPIVTNNYRVSYSLSPGMLICTGTWILFVYLKTRKTTRKTTITEEQDRKVVSMSLLLACYFTVLWLPYFCLILWEALHGVPASPEWDQFSCIHILNSAGNPILLYKFDATIRSQVNDLLGFSKPVNLENVRMNAGAPKQSEESRVENSTELLTMTRTNIYSRDKNSH